MSPAENSSVFFALLRHGRTVWNQQKKIQGRQDSPLLPETERVVTRWARQLAELSFTRVLTSSLGRAQDTARLVNQALDLPLSEDPRLIEQDWGEWTGRTLESLEQEDTERLAQQETAGWGFRPPGGEDRREVWQRSIHALMDAREQWPGERILVVTHEGVIKCLVYGLAGRRFLPTEPKLLKNGFVHFLSSDQNGLVLDRPNALKLKPWS
jgi:broad specificity phosphatase PhoE